MQEESCQDMFVETVKIGIMKDNKMRKERERNQQMKKYRITDIIEDEFGCEGRPEGEEPMVTILLVDDTGKQRSIRMADKLAYEKKLDIGAEMELPEEEIMTLNGKEYKVMKSE